MLEKAGKTVASPGRFNAKMMGKHGLTHTEDEKMLGSTRTKCGFHGKNDGLTSKNCDLIRINDGLTRKKCG